MSAGVIVAICIVSFGMLLYMIALIYIHCFGKIYRFVFPSPQPMYTEKFFGEKLKYANVFNSLSILENKLYFQ